MKVDFVNINFLIGVEEYVFKVCISCICNDFIVEVDWEIVL